MLSDVRKKILEEADRNGRVDYYGRRARPRYQPDPGWSSQISRMTSLGWLRRRKEARTGGAYEMTPLGRLELEQDRSERGENTTKRIDRWGTKHSRTFVVRLRYWGLPDSSIAAALHAAEEAGLVGMEV